MLALQIATGAGAVELAVTGQWRQGFAVADLDGDGDLDVVHGPPRAGDRRPRLFRNDGAAGFRPWEATGRLSDLPIDYGDVAVADFDGDRRADLAFGVHLGGVGVLIGDGLGGFRQAPGLPDWSGDARFPTVAIEAVDWDGDHRPDLVALAEGPRPGATGPYGLRILGNREHGWERIEGEDPGRLFGDVLAIGDFDGDGRPDAAAGSRSLAHRGQVFLGRGAGGWALAEAPVRKPAYLLAVTACDLDRDGRDELIVGFLERSGSGWRNGVDRLDLDADTGWRRVVVTERAGEEAPRALGCGDLDGDGQADLAVGSATGELRLFRGKAGAGFHRPRRIAAGPAAAGCGTRHLETADLDGDGRAELVASFAAEPGSDCESGGALMVVRAP